MGAFNTLRATTVCPVCKTTSTFDIQFKYGNTWQDNYEIGSKLRWGGNDKGIPGLARVLVEGIGGPCPNCGAPYVEFDIMVECDTIVGVR